MPNYDYECQSCGHTFETSQRITEKALTDCPQCKQPKLQRLISAPAFHLKGGGWYKDGYASTKAEGGGGGETKTESKPSETKTESKPAASSDSGGASTTSSPKAAE